MWKEYLTTHSGISSMNKNRKKEDDIKHQTKGTNSIDRSKHNKNV